MTQKFTINADFPGGNILVEKAEEDHVYLRQDLRDTSTFWFYWAFCIRGAQGRNITFHFTGGDVLGVRGPAVSYDNGASWQWLGDNVVNRDNNEDITFSHEFLPKHTKVLFAFCPVYTQQNLDTFLSHIPKSTFLQKDILCKSRKGRDVELLRLGNSSSAIKVLFTCRHHSCEATASYVLEGILETLLGEDETGNWWRENIDVAVIPFVDKHGVEEGDQGKNRAPHDHNRDYAGESIYPEVRAIRQFVPDWLRENDSCIALDLHCPHIRGDANEDIYFVGSPSPQIWKETQKFSRIWEKLNNSPIPFDPCNNLPFGQKWNVANNYAQGKSFGKWACELPNMRLASAIEFPYANAGAAEVNPENYRELGNCLAKALREYLEIANIV